MKSSEKFMQSIIVWKMMSSPHLTLLCIFRLDKYFKLHVPGKNYTVSDRFFRFKDYNAAPYQYRQQMKVNSSEQRKHVRPSSVRKPVWDRSVLHLGEHTLHPSVYSAAVVRWGKSFWSKKLGFVRAVCVIFQKSG